MKLAMPGICALLVAGMASAQGLGDAARKEQERRKENHDKGVAARSFSDDDLSGGGSSSLESDAPAPSSNASRSSGDRPSSSSSSSSSTSGGGSSLDGTRAAGRRQLDAIYGRIASQANQLIAEARGFSASGCDTGQGHECDSKAARLGRLACAVGQNLEEADDLGRQAWLQPGEVRDLRDRHGLEDALWYEISRLSNQYCR